MKSVILIGAGDRGRGYASFALKNPAKLKVAAVAEPNAQRRRRFARDHNLGEDACYEDWRTILDRPQLADGAIIATQDQMHVDPCVRALEAGYHVLLEKPMALNEADCRTIADAAAKNMRSLNICHVLRYTGFFRQVKAIIDEGVLGDVYTVLHAENVTYSHMAHSYVRGNWRNSEEASPMILAKCCHDMDILYWLVGSRPRKISSFGSLHHFRPEKAPMGAPRRCTDGCPAAAKCQYNAVESYLYGRHMKQTIAKTDYRPMKLAMQLLLNHPKLCSMLPVIRDYVIWPEWPTAVISEDISREGIMKALQEGPYGLCVYHCDNDQVDHQETIIEFENGTTATLRMHGHSYHEGRTLRIDGEHGTLRGTFGDGGKLEVHLHHSGKCIKYPVRSDLMGHGEGDYLIMEHFCEVLDGHPGETSAEESLMSHLMSFAAHEARINNKVVALNER